MEIITSRGTWTEKPLSIYFNFITLINIFKNGMLVQRGGLCEE